MSARGETGQRIAWVTRKLAGGGGLQFQPVDANRQCCTVCQMKGIVSYALAYDQIADFSMLPGDPELKLPTDLFFCDKCTNLIEQDRWSDAIERRLVNFAGDGTRSGSDRIAFVIIEFHLMQLTLVGRNLTYVDSDTDFRFTYVSDFAPGSLPVAAPTDDRDPDAHAWLDQLPELSPLTDDIEAVKEGFRRLYSYAIPGATALRKIAACSPAGIVEMGAGNGYWAYLLRNAGVDVHAYDAYPISGTSNDYWRHAPPKYKRFWSNVERGDERALLREDRARTLLLVWPPQDSNMAYDVVQAYRGDTVCYVGDWRNANGDKLFHNAMKLMWRLDRIVRIPTWYGFFDQLAIFHRRPEEDVRKLVFNHQAMLELGKERARAEFIQARMNRVKVEHANWIERFLPSLGTS